MNVGKTLGEIRDEQVAQAFEDGRVEGRSQANAQFRAKLESVEARIKQLEEQLRKEENAPCGVCAGERVLLTGEPCTICSQTGLESEEVIGLRKECFRLANESERQRTPAPGTKEAVIEAVRLICGEAPTYIENSDQWTLPGRLDPYRDYLGCAVREAVRWLDDNATKGDG